MNTTTHKAKKEEVDKAMQALLANMEVTAEQFQGAVATAERSQLGVVGRLVDSAERRNPWTASALAAIRVGLYADGVYRGIRGAVAGAEKLMGFFQPIG